MSECVLGVERDQTFQTERRRKKKEKKTLTLVCFLVGLTVLGSNFSTRRHTDLSSVTEVIVSRNNNSGVIVDRKPGETPSCL